MMRFMSFWSTVGYWVGIISDYELGNGSIHLLDLRSRERLVREIWSKSWGGFFAQSLHGYADRLVLNSSILREQLP